MSGVGKMRVDQKIGEARGLLAEALALQESGVLVSGMTVTDLATGFVVTGDAEMQRPGYLQYEGADSAAGAAGRADAMDDVEFQRSGLSLGRLSELFEMVSEVLEQRQEHPEAAAVNPPEPRELFPLGYRSAGGRRSRHRFLCSAGCALSADHGRACAAGG